MPKQECKFTKTTDHEERARLLRLKEMGISIGSCCHPAEPERLTLAQTKDDYPRLYVLPSGMVAVVLIAKVTVRISGVLITDVAMWIPAIDCELDLSDRGESKDYSLLAHQLPYNRTHVLNDWLRSGRPLGRREEQGAIIAEGWPEGWPSVPPWHDETPVAVELLLQDERRDRYHLGFEARVDRSLRLMYERRQQEHRGARRLVKREGKFGSDTTQSGHQNRVSQEGVINPREIGNLHDRGFHKPN